MNIGVEDGGWYVLVKGDWLIRGVDKGGCKILCDGRFIKEGDVLFKMLGVIVWGLCGDGLWLFVVVEGLYVNSCWNWCWRVVIFWCCCWSCE